MFMPVHAAVCASNTPKNRPALFATYANSPSSEKLTADGRNPVSTPGHLAADGVDDEDHSVGIVSQPQPRACRVESQKRWEVLAEVPTAGHGAGSHVDGDQVQSDASDVLQSPTGSSVRGDRELRNALVPDALAEERRAGYASVRTAMPSTGFTA